MVAPFLEFRSASLAAGDRRLRPLDDVDLALAPGDLVWAVAPDVATRLPLADAACGLLRRSAGAVRLGGDDWETMSPPRAALRRGRIGRVYHHGGWVANLNVRENVVLARRHHTDEPDEQIAKEADAWARRFGLESTPRMRPSEAPIEVLRVAEWIRAMLCRPRLLLLENPLTRTPSGAGERLAAAVVEQRERGCAVLWISAAAPPSAAGEVSERRLVRGRRLAAAEESP